MDAIETIKGRRSVRKFKPEPVKEEDIQKILDAGRFAPSAGNCQPSELVIIKEPSLKRRLAAAALEQAFIAEAPVVVVVCANIPRTSRRYGKRGQDLYCLQDTAAAAQNILLAAYSLGYGTCWIGAFDERAVADVIQAPSDIRPVAIIPIGRPAVDPVPPPRRPLRDIVHENKF
jgi:nitroreductase